MKKIILPIVLLIVMIMVAVVTSFNNGKTNLKLSKSWILKDKNIKSIVLYGTEQPLKVALHETDQEVTTILAEGIVSKETLKSLKKAKVSDSEVYIPFTKKGFKWSTSTEGKDVLNVTINLRKDAIAKEIFIDPWNGNVNVLVLKTFNGSYDIKLNQDSKLLHIPQTDESDDSTIKVDAYGDVTIEKANYYDNRTS